MVMRVCWSNMAGEAWVHETRFVRKAQIREQNNRLETGPDTEKLAPRDQVLPTISHPNLGEGLQSLQNNAMDASSPPLLTLEWYCGPHEHGVKALHPQPLRKLRQEDGKFKSCLGNLLSSYLKVFCFVLGLVCFFDGRSWICQIHSRSWVQPWCVGLSESALQRLGYLNTWSPFGGTI